MEIEIITGVKSKIKYLSFSNIIVLSTVTFNRVEFGGDDRGILHFVYLKGFLPSGSSVLCLDWSWTTLCQALRCRKGLSCTCTPNSLLLPQLSAWSAGPWTSPACSALWRTFKHDPVANAYWPLPGTTCELLQFLVGPPYFEAQHFCHRCWFLIKVARAGPDPGNPDRPWRIVN